MEMDITQKINEIAVEYFGDNNVKFAKFMDTSETNIRSYRLKTVPKVDFVVKLCKKLEINLEWFLNNEGEKKKSATPTYSAPLVRQLSNDLQMPKVVTIDSYGNNNISLVNVKARAGYLHGFGDPEFIEKLPAYNLPGLSNKTMRAFELEGHSMNPTLHNRDIVFSEWVEGIDYIREDRVHVLVTKTEGIVIKRLLNRVNQYGYVIAKSDAINQRNEFPNIHIPAEDIAEIWYPKMYLSADFRSPSDMWQRMNNFESDLEEIKRQLSIKPIH